MPDLDKQTIRWVKSALSNPGDVCTEEGGDVCTEELRGYFIEGGLTPEQADYWLTQYDFYRLNIVVEDDDENDRGIFNPHTETVDPLPDNI
jgi:hypothetical protein